MYGGYGGGYPPPPAGYSAPQPAYGAPAYGHPPPVGHAMPPQPGHPDPYGHHSQAYGYPTAPPPGSYIPAGYAPAPVYSYGPGYGGAPVPQPGYGAPPDYRGHPPPQSAPSPQSAPAADKGRPDALVVSGCKHETVGGIVRGNFNYHSDNHSKPVYKRDGQVNGLDVMLYFWDDRDGPNFGGWWFGPKVGGDQVWAYHPDKSAPTPPATGWKVPYDGNVDTTFKIDPVKVDKSRRNEQKRKDEERKKQDEQKKRADDERKRREDEQKKKEEEAKKKEEEEKRKREEEANKKKDLEEKRRQEQKSTLAIRRVIQKVRGATPETFDELQKELQDVMKQELEATGTQRQRMVEESEKGIDQARKRIEQVNEQRRKDQEKKDAEERKRLEAENKAKLLVQELADLVTAAENKAEELKDMATSLEQGKATTLEDVEKIARAVEEAGSEAKSMTKACTDFILQRGPEMKDNATAPPAGVPVQPSEMKQTLAKLLQRINDCTRTSESNVQNARGAKEKAVRRAAAREKTMEMEALFEKYDKDSDDMLSRKEVIAFAKGEYKFTVPEDTLELVFKNVVEDGCKGVTLERFQLLKTSVGVARERLRDKKRRAEKAQKENVLKDMKLDLLKRIKEAEVAVNAADKAVEKVENQVKPFTQKARSMQFAEMIKLADETDGLIQEAKDETQAARDELDALAEGLEKRFEEDLKAYLSQEGKTLEMRMGRMGSRITRAENLCTRFRQEALRKEKGELEKIKHVALKVIIFNQRLKKLSSNEMFAFIDADRDGEISEQEFLDFFAQADKEIQDIDVELPADKEDGEDGGAGEDGKEAASAEGDAAKAPTCVKLTLAGEEDRKLSAMLTEEVLPRLFLYILETGETSLSKEALHRLTRNYMKVVKETVLTATFKIKSSSSLRRLEANEVVEILDGPFKEDGVDLRRARVRVMKDGLEGWCTVVGNVGVVFLKEGGHFFKVVKEIDMTDSFELADDQEPASSTVSRKLKEDEVLEVYECPRRDEKSGLTRMRAKAKSDGSVGWVTIIGNSGTVFLEVV